MSKPKRINCNNNSLYLIVICHDKIQNCRVRNLQIYKFKSMHCVGFESNVSFIQREGCKSPMSFSSTKGIVLDRWWIDGVEVTNWASKANAERDVELRLLYEKEHVHFLRHKFIDHGRLRW